MRRDMRVDNNNNNNNNNKNNSLDRETPGWCLEGYSRVSYARGAL